MASGVAPSMVRWLMVVLELPVIGGSQDGSSQTMVVAPHPAPVRSTKLGRVMPVAPRS